MAKAEDSDYDRWGKEILSLQSEWNSKGDESKHKSGGATTQAKSKSSELSSNVVIDPIISRLLQAINFDIMTPAGKRYAELDAVYRHPKTGGTVFIGGIGAASKARILKENNIGAVVNCQDTSSQNFFQKSKEISVVYHRFPIAHWWRQRDMLASDKGVRKFYKEYFNFVDEHISKGNNVLVHCLAGAHRAGTAGISYVMYAGKLNQSDAMTIVQRQRPVVMPIGTFPDLLKRLESALASDRTPVMDQNQQ